MTDQNSQQHDGTDDDQRRATSSMECTTDSDASQSRQTHSDEREIDTEATTPVTPLGGGHFDSTDFQMVRVPDHVASEIDERIRSTRFDSRDEYVSYVLERILRELGDPEHPETQARTNGHSNEPSRPPTNGESPIDKPGDTETENEESRERGAVKDRLESLGYL